MTTTRARPEAEPPAEEPRIPDPIALDALATAAPSPCSLT